MYSYFFCISFRPLVSFTKTKIYMPPRKLTIPKKKNVPWGPIPAMMYSVTIEITNKFKNCPSVTTPKAESWQTSAL